MIFARICHELRGRFFPREGRRARPRRLVCVPPFTRVLVCAARRRTFKPVPDLETFRSEGLFFFFFKSRIRYITIYFEIIFYSNVRSNKRNYFE